MNVAAILHDKGGSVTTAAPGTALLQVAQKLAEKKIGTVVIVGSKGEVAGIVSERDIVRAVANGGAASLDMPASQAMTAKVVTCKQSDTLAQLMGLMTAGRFRHLPVVEDGRLVGIVSIGDVVKNHIAEVEMEASAMREYIAHT
jgi:CBS domain-containing protein